MTRQKQAITYFEEGYACAQAVLLAFTDKTNLSKETAINLTAGFARGIGIAKSACGAVTGAIITIGLLEGQKHNNILHKNSNIHLKCDEFITTFKQKQKTILCPVILNKARKENKKTTIICTQAITDTVHIIEQLFI